MWLDSVPTLPLVGVAVKLPLELGLRLPSVLAPALDAWGDVTRVQVPAEGIEVECAGMRLRLLHNNFTAQAVLNMRTVAQTGAFQPALVHDSLQSYSSMTALLVERLIEALQTLAHQGDYEANRIGIIANIRLTRSNAPPGILRLVDHLSAPWPAGVTKSETMLLAELSKTEAATHRCHHHFKFDRSGQTPEALHVALDWQEVMAQPTKVSGDMTDLQARINRATAAAASYFEQVAFDDEF